MIYGSNIFVLQMKAFQRSTRSRFYNLYFIDPFCCFVFIILQELETKVGLVKRRKAALTAQIYSRIALDIMAFASLEWSL